jgi:hypothetical protein
LLRFSPNRARGRDLNFFFFFFFSGKVQKSGSFFEPGPF